VICASPVQAVSVGHALDVDSAGSGVVHSVFARAVNLTIGGDMWTLLAAEKADMPFGIRVALPDFDALGLRRGDSVNVRARHVGVDSRLVIDCRAAARWMPVCQHKHERGLKQRLAVVAKAARDRSWRESARMARAVRAALGAPATLGAALAKVVGRGPGATPAGDDVLVGILAVLTCPHSGSAGAEAAESLGCSILPLLPTTTDISGQLLRQAAHGLFGRDVHELVSALIGDPAPEQLRENVRQVLETGATSGADMCEGLLAFAPSFFTNHIERAAA
jgi:hypothetical protein